MGVDHPGVSMPMGDLLREVRRTAKATLQNASIGRAGIRVYDGGWIRIEGGGLAVTGTQTVSGTLQGSGTFNWTGPMNLQGAQSITGPTTFTGQMTVNGPWTFAGNGDITGNVSLDGDLSLGSGRIIAGSIVIDKNGGYGGRLAAATLLFDSAVSRFNGTVSANEVTAATGINTVTGDIVAATGDIRAPFGDVGGFSKSFWIDHPSKAGKQLRHGSLEGPEHGVYYRGVVEFDADGESVFELPDYFTALVLPDDIPTVQVTASGRPFLTGAEPVKDGRVTVYGEPGREAHVSVTAARGRFDIEPDKTESQ